MPITSWRYRHQRSEQILERLYLTVFQRTTCVMSLRNTVSKDYYERCYESHPPLSLGKFSVYGGSASHPAVKDADIYVSLQSGSSSGLSSDPWDAQHVQEIQFSISDACAPSNSARFKKLIDWLVQSIAAGKKVHIG